MLMVIYMLDWESFERNEVRNRGNVCCGNLMHVTKRESEEIGE